MPNSVIDSPRDEEKWKKAEQIAAKSGRNKDYAYIMGIYKKMNPDHEFKKSASSERDWARIAGDILLHTSWDAKETENFFGAELAKIAAEKMAARRMNLGAAKRVVREVDDFLRTGQGELTHAVGTINKAYARLGREAPKKLPTVQRVAAKPVPGRELEGYTRPTLERAIPAKPQRVTRRRKATRRAPETPPATRGLPTLSAAEVGAARSNLPAATGAMPYVKGEGTKQVRKLPQFIDDAAGPAYSQAGKRVRPQKAPQVEVKERPPTVTEQREMLRAAAGKFQRLGTPPNVVGKKQPLLLTTDAASHTPMRHTRTQYSGDAGKRVQDGTVQVKKKAPTKSRAEQNLERARGETQRLEALGDQIRPSTLQAARANEARLANIVERETQRSAQRETARKGTESLRRNAARKRSTDSQIKTTEAEVLAAQRALERAAKGGDTAAIQSASRELEAVQRNLSSLKGTAKSEAKRTATTAAPAAPAAAPASPAAPAAEAADKPGILKRLFGRKKKPAAETSPAPKAEAKPEGTLPVSGGGSPPASAPVPGAGLPVPMPQPQAAASAGTPGFWGGMQQRWNALSGGEKAMLGIGGATMGGYMAGAGRSRRGTPQPQPWQYQPYGQVVQTPPNIIRRPPPMAQPRY